MEKTIFESSVETGRFFWFRISNRSVNRRCIEVARKVLGTKIWIFVGFESSWVTTKKLSQKRKFVTRFKIREHLFFIALNIYCWFSLRVSQWMDRFWGSPPSGHQRQWKRSWSQSSYVWVCKIQLEYVQTYFSSISFILSVKDCLEFLKHCNFSHSMIFSYGVYLSFGDNHFSYSQVLFRMKLWVPIFFMIRAFHTTGKGGVKSRSMLRRFVEECVPSQCTMVILTPRYTQSFTCATDHGF